jgi:purine-binding chemotaxis protein CheW
MRIALPLQCVERVVRAVQLTLLPAAPAIVMGVINMAGRVIPVVNMRRRFRLPDRDIKLTDQFVIAHSGRRTIALVADSVNGVLELAVPEVINVEAVYPGLEYVDGIMRLEGDLILIHNLESFLSLEEDSTLERGLAMKEGT